MNKNINPIDLLTHLVVHGKGDIDEHLMTLFSLSISMKPCLILELGVRTARSTLPFLCACDIIDSKLISVDIDPVVPDFQFPDHWKQRWQFHQKDAIKFLEEDLEEVLQETSNSSRSRIFYIDDWHSYEHVKREIELISKYATPNDLFLLHDLMYYNSQPQYRSVQDSKDKQWDHGGPYRAIAELDLDEWEYSTIPRCNGMTILRKKAEVCTMDYK